MRTDRKGPHRTAFEHNKQIILATQDICAICGMPVDRSIKYPHPMSPSIDHIIPVSKGGHPSDLTNLQLAHRWCNRWKSDKMMDTRIIIREAQNEVGKKDLPQHFNWVDYKCPTT